MNLREVAEMALEFVDWLCGDDHSIKPKNKALDVRDALRQALAQPEQEPVAYVSDSGSIAVMVAGTDIDDDTPLYTAPPSFNRNASLTEDRYVCDCEYWEPPVDAVNMTQERVDETAKNRHEPVAWITDGGKGGLGWRKTTDKDIPLYTAPPKREWVGLTDAEVESWRGNYDFFDSQLVREVEAKLKEKNG